jgi:hypothetical protein
MVADRGAAREEPVVREIVHEMDVRRCRARAEPRPAPGHETAHPRSLEAVENRRGKRHGVGRRARTEADVDGWIAGREELPERSRWLEVGCLVEEDEARDIDVRSPVLRLGEDARDQR